MYCKHVNEGGGHALKLNVMTFNMHHGRGTDRKVDLERIAKVIRTSKADLIGLNEVDRYFSKRSDYVDQISWLAKKLNMDHAYGQAISLQPKASTEFREYGNAVLSRYPIVFQQNHSFIYRSRLMENRSLLEVLIELPQQHLKSYITHLSLNPFIHQKQTNFILQHCRDSSLPTVIMGDWNMRPKSRAWRKITRDFRDVCHEREENQYFYTFPSSRPKSQLDYIFISEDLHVHSVEVVQNDPCASDHLPLQATLSIDLY